MGDRGLKAAEVAPLFEVAGRLVRVVPTGSGNINDTYMAVFRTTFSEERFVLQRLNRRVFASPANVMRNMKVVTEHVHRRLEAESATDDRIWQLPRIIPTKSGDDFIVDADGDCWRAITLIASARAFDTVQNPAHAHEAGVVLGQFQRLVSDIPVDCLADTLPGYHIVPGYLAAYDRSLADAEGAARSRASADARYGARFVAKRRDWAVVLEEAQQRGDLIARPIHGDPKIANIMIDDETGKGTCMIDLDTVKPGLIHYDFGDCLRSCCNPAGEECLDLSDVVFDTDLCAAIVQGYRVHAQAFLTEADRHYLYDSIRRMTFELGLRFYADYLAGDRYFKTRYEGHNLNRAVAQFKLCESIETREPTIRRALAG